MQYFSKISLFLCLFNLINLQSLNAAGMLDPDHKDDCGSGNHQKLELNRPCPFHPGQRVIAISYTDGVVTHTHNPGGSWYRGKRYFR